MPTLPRLYAHPFSSYSQKALIALYENDTPFEYRSLEEPEARAELAALWPMGRFPVLVEQNRTVIEASCVIEYLDLHYPGPVRLIPADAKTALEVRMLDRFFDNYVSTPQQKVVFDARRPEENRDAYGAAEAGGLRGRPVRVLRRLDPPHRPGVLQRARLSRPLLARPSFARAVDEARPYRPYFPLGAPDRD